MKILPFFALFIIVGSCTPKEEKLIWSDEFNGTGLPNITYWSYDLGATGYGNNEIQYYTSDLNNCRQENGSLIIEAHKTGNEWTSARLISKHKFSFTYGKIVFRAKLPPGSGTWPALWLLAENIDSVGWPDGGEIDVMEHVGKNPGVTQCALHTASSFGNTLNKKEYSVPDFNTAFHTYEANRTADKIDFLIDGNLYYTYEPSVKNEDTWPFDSPFFIIMNIAMGGNWGSDTQYETNNLKNGIEPSLSTARMEVDYVRVYSNEATK